MSFNDVVAKCGKGNLPSKPSFFGGAQADRGNASAMSHLRFFGTFASLFLGLVLVYSSTFYLPAVLDIQKMIGMSTEKGKLPTPSTDSGKLSAYTDFFKIRRGYIRRGQALTLEYDLPVGTTMTASISRCSAPPVIEVFYCRNIEGELIKFTGGEPGKRNFVMRKSGFYYFDEVIKSKNKSDAENSYRVYWSRRNLGPA